jgi:predicted dehydrogenase
MGGVLSKHTAAGAVRVPSEQGAYQAYYTQFAAALRDKAEFPVPADEAVHTLEVLDAARTSAQERHIVSV